MRVNSSDECIVAPRADLRERVQTTMRVNSSDESLLELDFVVHVVKDYSKDLKDSKDDAKDLYKDCSHDCSKDSSNPPFSSLSLVGFSLGARAPYRANRVTMAFSPPSSLLSLLFFFVFSFLRFQWSSSGKNP